MPQVPISAVRQAFDAGDVAVTASIADSVPRYFGNVHQVVVIVAYGGFRFRITDEVGKHIADFDLLRAQPEPLDAVTVEKDSAAMLGRFGIALDDAGTDWPKSLTGAQQEAVAQAVIAAHRPRIRQSIAKLFPGLDG